MHLPDVFFIIIIYFYFTHTPTHGICKRFVIKRKDIKEKERTEERKNQLNKCKERNRRQTNAIAKTKCIKKSK